MDEKAKKVATAVRDMLRARGIPQSAVATRTNMSEASVSRMLSGKQPIPDTTLFEMAEVAGIPWDEFRAQAGLDDTRANATSLQGVVAIRVIDQKASASVRAGVPVEDVIYLREDDLRFDARNYRGIQISGSCMAPEIGDGDVVVVEFGSSFDSGDIVVAEVLRDGQPEIHVKRIRQRGMRWFLEDNEGGSLEVEPESVAGLVVRVTRTLKRAKRV